MRWIKLRLPTSPDPERDQMVRVNANLVSHYSGSDSPTIWNSVIYLSRGEDRLFARETPEEIDALIAEAEGWSAI